MQPVSLLGSAAARIVLTCEHASPALPDEYEGLGLAPQLLVDHIGWDIGAADLAAALGSGLGSPVVLSAASRLLVDCNRALADADLMPHRTCGVIVPGNAAIDADERAQRLARFYDPYHSAIDAQLEQHPDALLLSVHSFTPELNGCARPFDVGVLFDDFDDLARLLAERVTATGLTVRLNEPYSGLEGLIFSARSHGRRHGLRYLEIEVNNRLLRSDDGVRDVATRLIDAVASMAAVNDPR
jgi:predicted N-formylglutamate amidohydrolase